MPGMGGAVGCHWNGGFAADLGDWKFMFRGPKQERRSSVGNTTALKALGFHFKAAKQPDEICGTVQQLFKDKHHNGIFVELHGLIRLPDYKNPRQLLTVTGEKGKTLLYRSRVYQQLAGEPSGSSVVKTTAYEKFPFKLSLPADLPPSFESSLGYAEYKLIGFMRVHDKPTLLGETTVPYFGQWGISPVPSGEKAPQPLEQQVVTESVQALVQIPKQEFLYDEEIPFTIVFTDSEKNSVKKIAVSLLRIVACVENNEEKTESQIVDVVVFKRFLKREKFSRSGKFKAGKAPSCTYFRKGKFKLKIDYAIELRITTRDGKATWDKIPIVIGTFFQEAGPDDGSGPSAPAPEEEEDDTLYSASAPLFESLSLAGSLLSLLPPTYSQLSSRTNSVMSFATLPPHYDEVEEEDQ